VRFERDDFPGDLRIISLLSVFNANVTVWKAM